MNKEIKCKTCPYLKKINNYNYTNSSLRLNHPRCQFYCKHPRIYEVKNKIAPTVGKNASFVGYDDGFSYQLETLKTRLRWCPLLDKQDKEMSKND